MHALFVALGEDVVVLVDAVAVVLDLPLLRMALLLIPGRRRLLLAELALLTGDTPLGLLILMLMLICNLILVALFLEKLVNIVKQLVIMKMRIFSFDPIIVTIPIILLGDFQIFQLVDLIVPLQEILFNQHLVKLLL